MPIERPLIGVALVLGLAGGYLIARSRRQGRPSERPDQVHQILLPFTGTAISRRAVDAALRLARAEGAVLMPAYLAEVPKQLPLDCSIPAEAAKAMPMLEAIEQRATPQDVAVDSRVERGRSYRHALKRLLERGGVRSRRRPRDRGPGRRPLRRRPGLAARKGPDRGPDPAPGARGHPFRHGERERRARVQVTNFCRPEPSPSGVGQSRKRASVIAIPTRVAAPRFAASSIAGPPRVSASSTA